MVQDLYAIKSCVNGKLTSLGDNSVEIPIDFCNTFDMETSSDKVVARADGKDTITMDTSVERSFTLGMECLTEETLALLIGGTIDSATKKITVPAEPPTTVYSYEGLFTMTKKDGTQLVEKMIIPRCRPQANSSISFSAIDLSTFELPFDILAEDNEWLTIEHNTTTGGE